MGYHTKAPFHLQVLSPREAGGAGAGFAKAALIAQVELAQAGAAFSGSPKGAALAAGYLDLLPTELVRTPNKQVGVMTGNGGPCRLLLCGDSKIAELDRRVACMVTSPNAARQCSFWS